MAPPQADSTDAAVRLEWVLRVLFQGGANFPDEEGSMTWDFATNRRSSRNETARNPPENGMPPTDPVPLTST